jgi:TolB protein
MARGRLRGVVVVALAAALVACSPSPASPPPATPTPGILVPSATPIPSPAASTAASTAPAPSLDQPLGTTGTVALLRGNGSLAVIAADGRSAVLEPGDPNYAFPAWSPDGTRLAAIRNLADGTAIVVYDPVAALDGGSADPHTIFRSSTIRPFYLSWTPDGREVSYLATDPTGLALRVAPADATTPTDGTETTSLVRVGDPFYFDWIAANELVAHVGTGEEAFLGEIDRAGGATGPAIERPAAFRSPAVSHDGRYRAFARVGPDGSEVVVQERDGGAERSMPVFAMSAMAFDPVGDTIAALGADRPVFANLELPLGPVRLLDPASGDSRPLIDGAVISFWWSPDGRTIAALRAQPVEGGSEGQNEVRLLFVDVASGDTISEAVVQPGQLYVEQLLVYFDQYALSHRLWAPDGSSFLMPQRDADGATRIVAFFPDGRDPIAFDGLIGFWSP